jgi:hypothetical protein
MLLLYEACKQRRLKTEDGVNWAIRIVKEVIEDNPSKAIAHYLMAEAYLASASDY